MAIEIEKNTLAKRARAGIMHEKKWGK